MKRIYIVEDKDGSASLVKATTKASAMHHVAEKTYTVAVAGQDQLVELTSKGVKVEEAGNVPVEAAA